MITFNRSQVIGVEVINNEIVRFHGIQEDHIYGMEINMDVRIEDGQILSIDGNMKRYTNFVCPDAVPVLQTAVGISLREEGWDRLVMREIGRKGCEHFAEIIIECGRCLDPARASKEMYETFLQDPTFDQENLLNSWREQHPEAKLV